MSGGQSGERGSGVPMGGWMLQDLNFISLHHLHVRGRSRTAVCSMSGGQSKVLVTGATGFVGSNLCGSLKKNGYEVHVLRRSVGGAEELDQIDVVNHIGDVTNVESIENALSNGDGQWKAVFHAAGVIAYSSKMGPLMESVNVEGTRNVIAAMKKLKSPSRLVFVSSVVAVGANDTEDQAPLNEEAPWDEKKGNSVGYLRTKRAAEVLVHEAVSRNELDAVIVCPSNVYGASDAKKGSRSNQIKAAKGKLKFYTYGGVNVIGVRQCCNAIIRAMEIGKTGERYILGGENILIKDMLTLFSTSSGNQPPSIALPNWVLFIACAIGEFILGSKSLTMERAAVATLFHWYDSSKAVKDLGLEPTDSRQAIQESVDWMKENHILDETSESKKS